MRDGSGAEGPKGSLVVVGTGISVGQLTLEARSWIKKADKVLYCVADAATERLILRENPAAESLYVYYANDKRRKITYQQMIARTLECVRGGMAVCAVYYGHPGIFVYPSHESIRLARIEGFPARMLPAVSSLDCLFCDLGIDPALGCQIFEATDLVIRKRPIDVAGPVVVWQIAAVGDLGFNFGGYDCRNVPVLVDYLLGFYPPTHRAIVYEAAQYAVCDPVIEPIALGELASATLTGVSTLYIPASKKAPVHLAMLERVGLSHVLEGKTLVRHSDHSQEGRSDEAMVVGETTEAR
jgi:hypothetical protein